MISIIIPNYNKSQFVAETINSVKKQTYDNWEAIIIDDCSSDNSLDIIEKLISYDNKFRLKVNFSNKGANYSRNLGIKEAKGDFIIFLDSFSSPKNLNIFSNSFSSSLLITSSAE